jgi:hypothetical protein
MLNPAFQDGGRGDATAGGVGNDQQLERPVERELSSTQSSFQPVATWRKRTRVKC